MFEGNASTMLSSLDTVGSLNDDTLLWPGMKTLFFYSLFTREVVHQSQFCLWVICFMFQTVHTLSWDHNKYLGSIGQNITFLCLFMKLLLAILISLRC